LAVVGTDGAPGRPSGRDTLIVTVSAVSSGAGDLRHKQG